MNFDKWLKDQGPVDEVFARKLRYAWMDATKAERQRAASLCRALGRMAENTGLSIAREEAAINMANACANLIETTEGR